MKYYTHPFVNARFPLSKDIDLQLRDRQYKTDDLKIQELLKDHPLIKEVPQKEGKKAEIETPPKPKTKYRKGVSRAFKP